MGCEASYQKYNENVDIIRKTKYGKFSGKYYTTSDGFVSNIFLGIPYAEPPIGEYRFKKPCEVKCWNNIYKAHNFKDRCIQNDTILETIQNYGSKKSEDCLYLNIFTPNFEASKNQLKKNTFYPVFFFIHSGEYTSGSSNEFEYKNIVDSLIRYNIIIVTMNYRLGFLGHFYTGDETCQSNLALWDLHAALKWVKSNIGAFGGNKDNITVGGNSSGAVYADILSLSPITRNLFQRTIVIDGAATISWALSNSNSLIELCRNKALELGYIREGKSINDSWTKKDNENMIKYLRTLPSEKFVISRSKTVNYIWDHSTKIGPVIDGEFLPQSIKQLRAESEPKPVILGYTQHEELLLGLLAGVYNIETLVDNVTKSFKKYCAMRGTIFTYDQTKSIIFGNITDEIKNNKKLYKDCVLKSLRDFTMVSYIIEYCIQRLEASCFYDETSNDGTFSRDKEDQNTSPVYIYRFDNFNSNKSIINRNSSYIQISNINEIDYLIKCNKNIFSTKSINDKIIRYMFIRWIINFIKYGNPNDDNTTLYYNIYWKPATITSTEMCLRYLKISIYPKMESKICDEKFFKKAMIFNLLRNINVTYNDENSIKTLVSDYDGDTIEFKTLDKTLSI
ncbi:Carboxylesterase, type B domain-containing protein [Strongyloides ratti]|uniref:Carboxylic ester hydrolase n=1 Tax=Strongyloides ratti TaxID=34506 RepID=A0A090KUT4_STRRB|nr:Carboxylesterase, type B domain-containing protein [Strongyloides ratti]CEF61166.1 Carboxylesterase, type B domain-containing protein [Strongyloides ratti]